MAQQRYLKNAPIIEALIDIHTTLPSDIDIATLKTIHSAISKEYPEEKELFQNTLTFQVGKPAESIGSVNTHGYIYTSFDKKQVFQVRRDGFTFSRLNPYESWDKLHAEAFRLWELYASIAKPVSIKRIAVRYVNRLEIPRTLLNDFAEYLTAPPIIPKALPQGLSSYYTRIVVPETTINATMIITQALEPLDSITIIPVLLDIDIFREAEFDSNGMDAWETIVKFHDLKNKVFFESITDKMVKLCL